MLHLENRDGKAYEFKGSFKLKRQYEKESQRELVKAIFDVMPSEEIAKFQNGGANDNELKDLIVKYTPKVDIEEITNQINRKYIVTLLCSTNNIIELEAIALLNELDEDYGEEQVNERLAEIINEVFTQVGKVEYKTMPTWN